MHIIGLDKKKQDYMTNLVLNAHALFRDVNKALSIVSKVYFIGRIQIFLGVSQKRREGKRGESQVNEKRIVSVFYTSGYSKLSRLSGKKGSSLGCRIVVVTSLDTGQLLRDRLNPPLSIPPHGTSVFPNERCQADNAGNEERKVNLRGRFDDEKIK